MAEEKVLIALDLSDNSLKAVDYVGNVMHCHPKVEFTLLHVIKEPSPDTTPDPRERGERVEKLRSEMLALVEEAARRLAAHGIDEERIRVKIQICQKPVSTAELILCEREKGKYGTIVVGRRGMSRREEFLFGSVSSKIVREAKECSVWVIV